MSVHAVYSPGFKPTTFGMWASSHNHSTRAPAQPLALFDTQFIKFFPVPQQLGKYEGSKYTWLTQVGLINFITKKFCVPNSLDKFE